MHVGFGRALVRGLLIALVIPPLITDTDLRGLQDRVDEYRGGQAVVRQIREPNRRNGAIHSHFPAQTSVWAKKLIYFRRTVRCTPRILACVGSGPLGMAAGPTLVPSAASRDSSESICLTVIFAGSLVR